MENSRIAEEITLLTEASEGAREAVAADISEEKPPQIEHKFVLPYEYGEDEHYYVEKIDKVKKKPIYSLVKRLFDLIFSLLGLIITALPMIVIAIAVKADSKGPVFYKQERLGKNGKQFNLIKFRTMKADAEKNGAQWSRGDSDERITKVGRFLRKMRLDELPQLWLCFTGKLSIVGPRPEREIFYTEFEKHVHGFSERLKVKPGLTGLAQVSGGYDLRPEEKVLYDVEYIKKRSLWLDIKILFKTVGVVLRGGVLNSRFEEYNDDYNDPNDNFDHDVTYSDEFYREYVENFAPSRNKKYIYRGIKRVFDFTVALLGVIILSPLMLVIAVAIKIDSQGPVIFRQQRIGLKGKPFTCYKFRSMKIDAPHDVATSKMQNPELYLTKVGRVIRKLSLDELPQLFCCLAGTMSVIGYRPLVLTEEKCNAMRKKMGVFAMRPGISGYAQVHGRDDVYYKNKAIMDAHYVKNASLWFDIKLLFQTIGVVFRRKGNHDK